MSAPAFDAADYLLAGLAAAGAGAVNAIAGGGTLISFPTLVALGAGKVQANMTNTVALCPGYLGGALAQQAALVGEGARLRRLSVAAGLGGLAGSVLLVTTGEAVFSLVVPWLILGACALLAGQRRLRVLVRLGEAHHRPIPSWVTLAAIFTVSIYGGYFGAGLGILLLAVLGLLFDDTLPRLNAVKQVLALVVNVVAALFFSTSGDVLWAMVLVMAPAALLGGALGGRIVTRVNADALRTGVVIFGTALAFWYLLR